jgi:hypothetical protein
LNKVQKHLLSVITFTALLAGCGGEWLPVKLKATVITETLKEEADIPETTLQVSLQATLLSLQKPLLKGSCT